jgi:transcriptional regulator with GAF, ATPase, and Fis domain
MVVGTVYFALCHLHYSSQRKVGFRLDLGLRVSRVSDPEGSGLRPGDELVGVEIPPDGIFEPKSSYHWYKKLNDLELGETYTAWFSRQGERISTRVTPHRPETLTKTLYSVGSLAVVLLLTAVIWYRSRATPGVSLLVVVVFLGFLVDYGMVNMDWILTSVPLFSIFLVMDLVTMPLLLHLFLSQPTPWPPLARFGRRVWLLYLPQGLLLAFALVAFWTLANDPTPSNQRIMRNLGDWWIPAGTVLYGVAALGVVVHRFATSTPRVRKQLSWLFYGLVTAGVLSGSFFILKWNATSYHWIFGGTDFLLPIYALLAATVAFSFVPAQLDVSRVVNRSLVYAILTAAVAFVYLAAAGLLGLLVTRLLGQPSTLVTITATVFATAMFFPMRDIVQRSVDRLFFKRRYHYARTLTRISSEMVTILDLQSLAGSLLAQLLRDMSVRHGSFLLLEPDGRLELARSEGRPHVPDVDSLGKEARSKLQRLRRVAGGRHVARRSRVTRLRDRGARREILPLFEALEAEALVLLVYEDRILGALALGARTANIPYGDDEVELLDAVGPQLSVAVRNARAYSTIDKLNRNLEAKQQEILQLQSRLKAENVYLRQAVRTAIGQDTMISESEELRRVVTEATRVASTDSTVLITGETGTGKDLIARAIHESSCRAHRPLVTINCAAIPEGLLESELFGHKKGAFTGATADKAGRIALAHQGTLFLDEIGDMPPSLQSKLLRVLEDGVVTPVGGAHSTRVDVRVVAATNRDLQALVAEGAFRQDLYYRLHVVPIHIPPLRERRADIVPLADHFLERAARRTGKQIRGFSKEALDKMEAYDWPGNVRELANTMERAVVLADGAVIPAQLAVPPAAISRRADGDGPAGQPPACESPFDGDGFHESVDAFKRRRILDALSRSDGNKSEAARRLGLQRTYLYRLMKQLDI